MWLNVGTRDNRDLAKNSLVSIEIKSQEIAKKSYLKRDTVVHTYTHTHILYGREQREWERRWGRNMIVGK